MWSDPPYPSDRLIERLHYRCLLRKHSHLPSQKRRPPGRAQTHFNHASPNQWSTTAPGGKETKTSFVLPVLHQRASLGGSKSSIQQIQYVPGIHSNDNTNCSPQLVCLFQFLPSTIYLTVPNCTSNDCASALDFIPQENLQMYIR